MTLVAPKNKHLPALTGIRFLAIYHIFLHHIWAVFTYYSGQSEQTQGLFNTLNFAPDWLLTILSNGWISTSFFFMLSGFILAYIYWPQEQAMTATKKEFWVTRCARIYPIHLFVLLILVMLKTPVYIEEGYTASTLISGALGNAFLVQAWFPPWVPMWNWPSWTISVIVFLYLLMPVLIYALNKVTHKRHMMLLCLMPIVSAIPALLYFLTMHDVDGWHQEIEIFFSNFPLFWVAYFVSGMLLTRIFYLYREVQGVSKNPLISAGDCAVVILLILACIPQINTSLIYVLRYVILMPLYMIIIIDLARGKGMLAKLLSNRIFNQLGELGFSIFIWQAVILFIAFYTIEHYPGIADYQLLIACIGIIGIAYVSTHYIEKPIANIIKKRIGS